MRSGLVYALLTLIVLMCLLMATLCLVASALQGIDHEWVGMAVGAVFSTIFFGASLLLIEAFRSTVRAEARYREHS